MLGAFSKYYVYGHTSISKLENTTTKCGQLIL